MKLHQIQQNELKELREMVHEDQNEFCPILGVYVPIEDMVVDHRHRKKSDTIGKDGQGMIRGVIQRSANVIEGKLTNAYTRYGLHKFDITLPEFLRSLADYLENPPLEAEGWIHPSEAPKPKKLMRRSYNKLRNIDRKAKRTGLFPNFPKSGKMVKALQKLYDHYNVEPEYYK